MATNHVSASPDMEITPTDGIRLPGFGHPINEPADDLYPTALFVDSHEAPLLTTREYTMMELMNRITDKPCWDVKVFDDAIATKWKAELLQSTEKDISEKMVDWCIAEIKYKASKFRENGFVEALDGVFKSDTIISEELKQDLKTAACPLEDVLDKDKDWHPGSDDQVLDLVHPSIYPLVYGQSRILPDDTVGLDDCMRQCGDGQVAAGCFVKLRDGIRQNTWSKKYQWLPSDFLTPEGSDDVKVTSYINNVHPTRQRGLYSVIERIVAKAIPLWNATLTPLTPGSIVPPPRIILEDCGYEGVDEEPQQLEAEEDKDFEMRLEAWKEIYAKPDHRENEPDDDYYDRVEAWKQSRRIRQPEPKDFKPPEQRNNDGSIAPGGAGSFSKSSVDLRKHFGKLQIIVKLANIHLTPEKPEYKGGSWHVEGQANEAICATALYYYDSSNISESLLAFRQQVENGMDLPYEQDDHRAVETIYGFENEGPTIQELGQVVTREGRLLTFPNVMQHRVHPFHLEEPTRPGHRRILALFLVDPHRAIISTSNVPCQQKDWWRDQIRNIGPLGQMPPEITDHIISLTDGFPVSLEVAKEQRLELMEERKNFVATHQEGFESTNTFSLCEH